MNKEFKNLNFVRVSEDADGTCDPCIFNHKHCEKLFKSPCNGTECYVIKPLWVQCTFANTESGDLVRLKDIFPQVPRKVVDVFSIEDVRFVILDSEYLEKPTIEFLEKYEVEGK